MYKRTNVEIDAAKLKKAKKLLGETTTKKVVDFALARLVRSAQTLMELASLRGKVPFDPDYNYKRTR